jgi:cytochrome c2
MTARLATIFASWIVWLAGMALTGCRGGRQLPGYAAMTATGDPARGHDLIAARSCGACHAIPHVVGASGVIGPPLGGIGRRSIISGGLSNTPANLARWVRDPEGIEPNSAMPNLALDEDQARDVAAYLEILLDEP